MGAAELVFFNDAVMEQILDGVSSFVVTVLKDRAMAQTPAPENTAVLAPGALAEAIPLIVEPELPPVKPDQVVSAISNLVGRFKTGESLSSIRAEVAKYSNNLEARAELLNSLLTTHDFDRLANFLEARNSLEQILLNAAKSRNVTPTQALAFLKLISDETKELQRKVAGGATTIKDLEGLLNKTDFALQSNEESLKHKFASTSPQGREIVRKLAYRLQKMVTSDSDQ